MFRPIANRWQLLALPLLACGSTSGPVLEGIKEGQPPDSNLRADVFLVRDVRSCAIGEACRSADPDDCFTLSDAAGVRLAFRPESVQFVPPSSPEIAFAEQAECFRLTIDADMRAAIASQFAELRQRAFQLSSGEINLGLVFHDLDPIDAGFKRWEGKTGLFLQPDTLGSYGLSVMSRNTDFVFALTGSADPSASLLPKIEECGGTNWLAKGGFGGSAYTWLSPECVRSSELLWHFVVQSYMALRDVTDYPDVYRGKYPACGAGSADPRQWFPWVGDCQTDPDSPDCDTGSCDRTRFLGHILGAHWPEGQTFVGNHCRNGKLDFDEVAVDSGGVCDLLGR